MEEKTETTDKIVESRSQIQSLDTYWKDQANKIYESELALTDPTFIMINHIRQALRFYFIPALEAALNADEPKRKRFLNYHSIFFSADRMNQFLSHFYWIAPTTDGAWKFLDPDIFDQDNQILYDLYKVRRTISGIQALLKDLAKRRTVFPSIYSKETQIQLLQGMNSALFMVFKQIVKPEYQVELFKKVNLEYIDEDEVARRRKKGIVYCRPSTLDKNPYRRIFLYILFRTSIQATINKKKTEIRYDIVDYEQMIHEYFNHYLQEGSNDMDATGIFHALHIQSKSMIDFLIEDANPENLIYEEIDDIKTLV